MLYFDEDSVLPATLETCINANNYAVAGCKVASYEINITPAVVKIIINQLQTEILALRNKHNACCS